MIYSCQQQNLMLVLEKLINQIEPLLDSSLLVVLATPARVHQTTLQETTLQETTTQFIPEQSFMIGKSAETLRY